MILKFRQRRSRSKERDHERGRKAGPSNDKKASKSPERKTEEIKVPVKTEAELKEEAAAAALIAKVNSHN